MHSVDTAEEDTEAAVETFDTADRKNSVTVKAVGVEG